MKVLHVYKSYYPDTVGGIEQVIAQLAQGLREFGVESRLFTLSSSPQPRTLEYPDLTVHRARTAFEIASNAVSFEALRLFPRCLAWADVVHYQFPWPYADLLHLVRGRGKPSVVSYQSDVVRQKTLLRVYRPLMDRFLRRVDAVVATSPGYQGSSEVLRALGEKVHVIPNGIDPSRYPVPAPAVVEHWRARVGSGFLLFVGVLRYYKGLEYLVRAAQGSSARVVIAGEGPERHALVALAAQLGVADRLVFLGHIDEDDKMALLRLASGFVFPSHLRSEAFGMSLLEAAMCGLPMISCEIGTGTSYINHHGVTGWVVPPADPDALRSAMHSLLADPERARALGAAARERFEACFTARHMAQRYAELYRSVLPAAAALPQPALSGASSEARESARC